MATTKSEVSTLLEQLKQFSASKNPNLEGRALKSLQRLKILGRETQNLGPIVQQQNLDTLCFFALTDLPDAVAHEALRCLANTMLLKPEARQTFIDLGAAPKVAKRLAKQHNTDDEFVCCRILFYLTYAPGFDIADFVKTEDLGKTIIELISAHVEGPTNGGGSINPMQAMALSETAKLLYNVLAYHSELESLFTGSIEPLFLLISQYRTRLDMPLDQPVKFLVNALLNLNLGAEHSDTGPILEALHQQARILLDILDAATIKYKPDVLNMEALPLVTLIRKLFDTAPDGVKLYMRTRMLPSDEERYQPLGKSDTLASRLLQLSTSASSLDAGDLISGLMFELSDKNPDKFVQNVGLGFAAGYLAKNNIPLPTSATVAPDADPSHSNTGINPVTGQYLAAEPEDKLPPMTEEEKEREAERLFVLFERLRATGVVDVKNPVEEAYRSGKFE